MLREVTVCDTSGFRAITWDVVTCLSLKRQDIFSGEIIWKETVMLITLSNSWAAVFSRWKLSFKSQTVPYLSGHFWSNVQRTLEIKARHHKMSPLKRCSFPSRRWVVLSNVLLSLYSLAVDTPLPLYTFTLHKALNSWHTLLEWREKGPILPTPFKCFQGEKGPIQLLEVEEVLWRTLVRYLSSDIDVEEKERARV